MKDEMHDKLEIEKVGMKLIPDIEIYQSCAALSSEEGQTGQTVLVPSWCRCTVSLEHCWTPEDPNIQETRA